jgi:hypothetical protein
MKPLLKIVVDCDRWCRGSNSGTAGGSRLLTGRGYRCCLGFVAKKLGYTDASLMAVGTPAELEDHPSRNSNVLCYPRLTDNGDDVRITRFTSLATEINDDREISDTERMSRLRALGRKHGVLFRFANIPKKKKGKK